MPFPPIHLHQRISSPGRELFRKKKPNVPPQTEKTIKSVGERGGSDKDKVSTSWPSANLRNLGRKPQQETSKSPTQRLVSGQETQGKGSWLTVPRPQESSDGVRRSSSMESTTHRATRQSLGKAEGGKEIQFTLSLTPEAILVIQKRNLEKQMMAKQQKCCASADFRHRRVFPSKKTHGGSKSCIPVAKLESADQDITTIVKISLLNDQYKYDDVEYEEEDGDVDETVVRKCKEWLKGVESAAAFGKVDKFSALPHLKGYLDCGFAMRSKCEDIHQSSTLPSILDTYLLPVGVRKAEDEDKAQYWRRKVVQDRDPDQEAKARRQAQLEQRHLEAFRKMHRVRDALHRRYAALLREKIQSQRSESQQRHDTATTKPQNETKQKQSKLAFSMLQHNDSYLRSLPKTSYYLILDLQNRLAQRGCLKRHQDLEDFCRCINYNYGPSQLQRSLQDIRRKMVGSRSAADLMTQQKTRGSPRFPISAEDGGHVDQVSRTRPPSQSSVLKRGSASGESSAGLLLRGSQEQEETEQMFPKMKVPTFVTLQPNFLRNVQSKMPQLIIPEIPEKSRKAEIYLRRLRQMHDISLTNMAFSKRLLDRERDSLCWQEERSVPDLVPSVFPLIDSKQGKTSQVDQPLHPLKQSSSGQNDQPQSISRMTSASHQCLETILWNTSVCCRKTPDPLSMEDVCQQKPVQILDHGFKLWSNYTEDTDY